ncbi:hypothetical protein [Opitutus terrae]|uniref:Uncharacterized protein n=1 Tax=Opitutus terrae (strain DSM 11246 / JCM 15787 / PB90-1) TaxID=452637 RepID=B1ZY32_OPITP|nr:hypothetical protein [Opitutus terrae]ACB76181.1 hypothetical protein Oter_2900 [Opitutus terrae PB90-1]
MLVSLRTAPALLTGVFALGFLTPLQGAAPSSLAGHWRYDAARSTELSPWQSFDLTVTIAGDKISLQRRLGWARRDFEDRTDIDLSQPVSIVAAPWWPDNRHLGAYASAEHPKRIRAQWLDEGRILRVSTDQVLATQQGPREVNVLADYKVSASGTQLVVTELRSTRNRPIVYVFNRVSPAAQP